jgi:hypothetical protein
MKDFFKVITSICLIFATGFGVIIGITAYLERGQYMNGANVVYMGGMNIDYFPFTVYMLQTTTPFTFVTHSHTLELYTDLTEAKAECIHDKVRRSSTICRFYKLNLVGQTLEELDIQLTDCPDLLPSP